MGAGATKPAARNGLFDELAKPYDAADVTTVEECKAEVMRLRLLLRDRTKQMDGWVPSRDRLS